MPALSRPPILPGVVLLDQAQLAIEQPAGVQLTGLALAKFHRPVAPGEACNWHFQEQPAWPLSSRMVAASGGRQVRVDTEPAA
jgi:3-hydroxymyristoyl/3-hydroxydecanoyl-(acyl carrier protein) dehydratase